MKIILDYDDVLVECTEPALHILKAETGIDIKKDEVVTWGMTKFSPEIGKYMFSNIMLRQNFVENLKPYDGAIDFVRKLISLGHEVIIFSSVLPEVMTARALHIKKYFGDYVSNSNIVLGGHKEDMCGDIIVEDCSVKALKSVCRHKIIFDQPWNRHDAESLDRVSSYSELLNLICSYDIKNVSREVS